jgi:hypothetical protein
MKLHIFFKLKFYKETKLFSNIRQKSHYFNRISGELKRYGLVQASQFISQSEYFYLNWMLL